ncbi:hypothetical protein HY639_02785 [Candidatus Woesearchaeota archaeon]|nr:hypothetical protein [Candidatus Woesearchaeota archaeon]
MVVEIVLGRTEGDRKKFGTRGTIFLAKQYIKMGQFMTLANKVFMDVTRAHVVFVCGKRGGGKCLHGETLITLEDGTQKPIRDLEHEQRRLFSLANDLKIRGANKAAFYKREVHELLVIKLRSGKEIKLTPEHPLLTIKGWIPAEQLHLGSRIATPRMLPTQGTGTLHDCEVKLLAYLLAEGHMSNGFVLFANTDERIVTDFRDAVMQFDQTLLVKIHSKAGCFRIVQNRKRKIFQQAERNAMGQFTSKPVFSDTKSTLRTWLETIGVYGQLPPEKVIPAEIFTLPQEKLQVFLNRLFSCDGSIYRKPYWQISYCSSSRQLAQQVHHLLLRFGIVAKIRTKNGKLRDYYELLLNGDHAETFIKEIGFFGRKQDVAYCAAKEIEHIPKNPNVDTIPKEVWDTFRPKSWAALGRAMHYTIPKSLRETVHYAPSRQKLLHIAQTESDKKLELVAKADIFWDEIVGMEKVEGEFTVYDVTVPDYHNFVANDIIVHNSYTMGVIAEGMASLEPEIANNLSCIILDTMGVYWTMKYPNHKEEEMLRQWGLEGRGLDVQIFTPIGYYKAYKEKGIPTDYPFAIKPSELVPEDWCLSFGVTALEPVGVLIEKVINELRESGRNYSIADIIEAIDKEETIEREVRAGAINRFKNTERWGLFSTEGTLLENLVIGGKITVLDVSCYATEAGGWAIKSLVIGLVAEKLFLERMTVRKEEEFGAIESAEHFFRAEAAGKIRKPLVWLVIDEAHEFLPQGEKTPATDALVTILREGRQPGISLVLASQQPGKIHTDVMTQSDIIICHRITAKIDVDALGMLAQSYLRTGLDKEIQFLPPDPGSALAMDDQNERLYSIRVRPRFSWHGGEAPTALEEKKSLFG